MQGCRTVGTRVACCATILAVVACGGHHGGGSTGPNPPSGLAACTSAPPLAVSPVDLAVLQDIAPLGNLNPPGHTFPTDHIYLYTPFVSGGSTPAAVQSPGDIAITSVGRQTRSGGGQPDLVDYTVQFYPCADVYMYLGHLSALTADVLTQVGPFDAGCNAPYMTGGFTYQQCYKGVSITLSAGTALGAMGGPSEGALDLGAYDRRTAALAFVDPARVSGGGGGAFSALHTVCPIDYFASAVASAMRALLGGGGVRRSVAPVCGELMQDVANTGQGRWFYDATTNDDHHLALVHDNVVPGLGVFSMGTSVPSVPTGTYRFTPASSGRVNLDFKLVTADGNLYCYQSSSWPSLHIVLQVVTASTLRIQGFPGGGCGDASTWSLTGTAVQFSR